MQGVFPVAAHRAWLAKGVIVLCANALEEGPCTTCRAWHAYWIEIHGTISKNILAFRTRGALRTYGVLVGSAWADLIGSAFTLITWKTDGIF